jgi:glutaconate CoA-transferase subunit B
MSYTLPQLMVTAAAREIDDGEVVFVGMRLPLLGFLLAKSTHAKNAVGV